jgi:hypothetical protein
MVLWAVGSERRRNSALATYLSSQLLGFLPTCLAPLDVARLDEHVLCLCQ